MNRDFMDLKSLQNHPGYHKLQALWAHEYGEVMKGLQRSASKSTGESNWRYKAGEMKGFELAIGQLERALIQMEKEGEQVDDNLGTQSTEELLKELRGERKNEP